MKKTQIVNIHEVPFLRLLLPFLVGISLALFIQVEDPFNWFIIIALAFCSLMLKLYLKPISTHHWYGVAIHLTLFCLGYQIALEHDERLSSHHFSNYLNTNDIISVKVTEIPVEDKWVKFQGQVMSVDTINTSGNVLVYLKSDSLSPKVKYGDVLLLNSRVSEVTPPQNPNQFDYQAYLHYQNIHYQTFVQAHQWQVVANNQGSFFYSIIFKWRKNGLETLEKYLSPQNFSVGAALILGYKEALSDEVQSAFADTGSIHVLAVSGLHVGIIVMILRFLLGFMFKKIKRFRILQPVFIIACIWIFALLTGGSPSVLRATTMFSFVTIGLYMNRPSSIYNNLAISAFILLLINPFFIKSVGFQLSYLAVLGIVYFQPKIHKLWYIPNKYLDYFWTLTTVAIGAQIGTLPVSLYYFHQFPLLFFISGLIVIPAAVVILSLGLLTLFLEIWWSAAARFVGMLLDYVLEGLNWSIFKLQMIPIHKVEGIWVSSLGLILLFAVIFALVYWIQTTRPKGLIFMLLGLLSIAGLSAFQNIHHQQQSKVVVYSIYKKTAIDIIEGKSAVTLFSKATDVKSYQFASENFHTKIGIRRHQQHYLTDTIQSSSIYYNGAVLYFRDKSFLMISKNTEWKNIQNLKVDFVVICENPFLKIEELNRHVQCDQMIFDASNSKKSVEYWKRDCEKLGIDFYNINEKGAWIGS